MAMKIAAAWRACGGLLGVSFPRCRPGRERGHWREVAGNSAWCKTRRLASAHSAQAMMAEGIKRTHALAAASSNWPTACLRELAEAKGPRQPYVKVAGQWACLYRAIDKNGLISSLPG
jgi:hypothetical protein